MRRDRKSRFQASHAHIYPWQVRLSYKMHASSVFNDSLRKKSIFNERLAFLHPFGVLYGLHLHILVVLLLINELVFTRCFLQRVSQIIVFGC